MWFPRPIYEALPYGYVAAGVALIAWSHHRGGGSAGESALVVGAAFVVLGVVLKLRRRAFRQDTAKYDPRSLDE